METNNLLLSEISGLDSKVKWIETDVTEVNNILRLLIASQENESDNSLKIVLDLIKERTENILVNDIVEINRNITKIEKLADSLNEVTSKPKRNTKNNSTSGRRSKNKVVDIVEKQLDDIENKIVNE